MTPKRPGGWRAHPAWRVTKLVLGVALVLLGMVGLFVPVLQGLLFLFLGLTILSHESRWVRGILSKLRRRYPRAFEEADRLRERLSAWWSGRSKASAEEGAEIDVEHLDGEGEKPRDRDNGPA